jgi:hypothetical protein
MSKEQFHAAKSLPLAVAIGRFPQEVTRIACNRLDRCPALGIMSFPKSALPYKQSLTGPAVRCLMRTLFRPLWFDDQGQDIAEYAVMLAVILACSSCWNVLSDPTRTMCSPRWEAVWTTDELKRSMSSVVLLEPRCCSHHYSLRKLNYFVVLTIISTNGQERLENARIMATCTRPRSPGN